jgi:hypothetical protein
MLVQIKYDLEAHVEAVSSFTVQMKIVYSSNINHSFISGKLKPRHINLSIFALQEMLLSCILPLHYSSQMLPI